VQEVNLQTAENLVGFRQRELTLSFQHVVQMGLGNSGSVGESALGGSAAAHPLAKLFEETLVQVVEGHVFGDMYYFAQK
jgi:hypothetical protein